MIDKKFLFDTLRPTRLFGGRFLGPQVLGIMGIVEAYEEAGVNDQRVLAYALATAYHETGKHMSPIKETVMPSHRDKNPSDEVVIARLNNWARKIGRMSNIYWKKDPLTGKSYFGRGQVQLTWKDNYQRSSADAGVDLVLRPEMMMDPKISAKVLIKGLLDGRWNGRGIGIQKYLNDNDLKNARRTVNITDSWETIAGYYATFLSALKEQ